MANWADRILAVVNTFTGRPSPTDTSAAFQVRAPLVNQNFQGSLLAVAFCQALGTECADNTSTNILCKLKLVAGRFAPGDRVTVIEDRPTGRVWCALVTGTGAVPLVEFADAQLQDATLAGTADYDTIKDDLLIVETAPLDSFVWPRQAILVGGAHGLSGTVIPWQDGNTQTIEAKLLTATGPAGIDTEVQFNDAGDFGGAPGLVYDKTLRSVVLGEEGLTSNANEIVHSGGMITMPGDCQKRELVAGLKTGDGETHVVIALPLESGKSYNYWGVVTARNPAGLTMCRSFTGGCENTGGVSRDVAATAGAFVTVIQDAGAAGFVTTAATNVAADTLDISVQDPDESADLNWSVVLEWNEVAL